MYFHKDTITVVGPLYWKISMYVFKFNDLRVFVVVVVTTYNVHQLYFTAQMKTKRQK